MRTEVLFEWQNDWAQLRAGHNWRTFHFVMLEVEDDRMLGAAEITVKFLGFGFRVRWNHSETELTRTLSEFDPEEYKNG